MEHFLYTIDERHIPIPTHDSAAWANWLCTADRSVAKTTFPWHQEDILISTVFLGSPHPWKFGIERDDLALFETMVFGPEEVIIALIELSERPARSIMAELFGTNDIQERYATWDEAVRGHTSICQFVEVALPKINKAEHCSF